ncbi:branched-chain amino acid ABC transporter permease [Bradyrhizobium sp.]|uniref:branched-chain amino acid ABC transporter permease n=1 Tax=Bradyrhizobium sp. TaxID=376 RepID=UPI0039E5A97F
MIAPSVSRRKAAGAIVTLLLVVAIAATPLFVANPFVYHVGILVGIEALLALSVHLMIRIGQLSLAQAGLMGVGAYVSALVTRDLQAPFLVGFSLAVVTPGLIAAVIGSVALRVRGAHFALLTFALGEAIVLLFVEFVFPFGGNNGLMNIPSAGIGRWTAAERPEFYLLVLVVLVVAIVYCRGLLSGRSGTILQGLLDNEALLQSWGINALSWRLLVFASAAAIAGAAGSLYAHYLGFISPEAFNVTVTVNALVMNVVGGLGFLAGPVLGALLLVPLPELFRSALLYQQLLYGLSLLLLMLFLPRGLAGLLRKGGS